MARRLQEMVLELRQVGQRVVHQLFIYVPVAIYGNSLNRREIVEEEFRTVAKNEMYAVSNLGNVKSFYTGRILRQAPNSRGYLCVSLHYEGRRTSFLVHRLVMEAFCGESELQVNHIDGNKRNNRLDNLEYVTCCDNVRHAIHVLGVNGDKSALLALNEARRVLSDEDVKDIRASSLKSPELARKYGVSDSYIRQVKIGRCRKEPSEKQRIGQETQEKYKTHRRNQIIEEKIPLKSEKIIGNHVRKGEKVWNSKLTEADVIKIRSMYKRGEYGCMRIAKELGMRVNHVRDIVTRRLWKHVPEAS